MTPLATVRALCLRLTDNRRWLREKSDPWSSKGRRWRKRLREWWRRSRRLPWSSRNILKKCSLLSQRDGKDTKSVILSLKSSNWPGSSPYTTYLSATLFSFSTSSHFSLFSIFISIKHMKHKLWRADDKPGILAVHVARSFWSSREGLCLYNPVHLWLKVKCSIRQHHLVSD